MKNRVKAYLLAFGVVCVLVLSASLRFVNLGYSEYIPDETTVMYPIKKESSYNLTDLITQRKGPIQFFVARAIYSIGVNPNNELWYRVPFALAQLFSYIFLFLALKRFTGSYTVALLSILILSLNGFTVAFGRVVQYQNFNMLFSFVTLYVLSVILTKSNLSVWSLKVLSTVAALLWTLSFMSHWDALFILPLIVYAFYKLYLTKPKNEWMLSLKIFTGICIVILVPFVGVYLKSSLENPGDTSYFTSRIGYVDVDADLLVTKFDEYKFRSELYNPVYYLPTVLILSGLAILELRRNKIYFAWLIFCLFLFVLFVKKPGTHLYNIYIPLSILSAWGIYSIAKYFKGYFALIPITLVVIATYYPTYQNYTLFGDYKVQYPWEQEILFGMKTPKYDQRSLSNNIIGFPMNRNWEEINRQVIQHLQTNGLEATYVTNEVRSISSFYMDIEPGVSSNYYAIGIKTPFSFERDYSFPQIHNRETISKVYLGERNTARVYYVNAEQK